MKYMRLTRKLILSFFFLFPCISLSGQSNLLQIKTKADSFNALNQFDSSEVYYVKLLEESKIESNNEYALYSFLGIGIANRYDFENHDYAKGLSSFHKAFALYFDSNLEDKMLLATIVYHLATTYRVQSDYKKAEEFAKLSLILSQQSDSLRFLGRINHGLANILAEQGKYAEAIPAYENAIRFREALQLPDDYFLPEYYRHKALTYYDASSFTKSIEGHKKVADLLLRFEELDSLMLSTTMMLISRDYCSLENLEEASYYYEQAQLYAPMSILLSGEIGIEYFQHMGKINQGLGRLDSAIAYLHTAFSLNRNPIESDIVSDSSTKYFDLDKQFFLFEDLGGAYSQQYKENPTEEILIKASRLFAEAHITLGKYKNELEDLTPILHVTEHAHHIYELAIQNSMVQYEKFDDLKSLKSAFRYMESNKHYTLLKNKIRNSKLLKEQRKDNFNNYILDSLRNQLQMAEKPDTAQVENILINIAGIINQQFFEDTSESTSISPDFNVAAFDEVKAEIDVGDCYVSYYTGETNSYALFVTKNDQDLIRIKNSLLRTQIREYRKYLLNPKFISDIEFMDSIQLYAYNLYSLLLGPTNSLENEIRNFIISPDGLINHVPFQSLIVEKENTPTHYGNLKYLIQNSNVSRVFSFANYMMNRKDKFHGKKMLAIANPSLARSNSEIELICNKWNGENRIISGKSFSENEFVGAYDQYDIVHIASHSNEDRESSEPYISFSADNFDLNERLYNYEIHGLANNASLVTMSSCETVLGQDYTGEGIFNLARSFNYIGCPAIVLTMWKMSDVSASIIFPTFYEHLNGGATVSTSLRNAQLAYLEKSNVLDGHPYYWAGIGLLGDYIGINGNFKENNNNHIVILFVAIFVLAALIIKRLL